MAIGTRIPVKSSSNDTDLNGSQPTTKLRVTEAQALNGWYEDDTLQASYTMIEFTEQEKWRAVYQADYDAEVLCSKGRNLRGGARLRWIAGRCGLTVVEVKRYLGKV